MTQATSFAGLLAVALLSCSGEREAPPAAGSGVHPAGFLDQKSADFHGTSLRARRWSPMLDAQDPEPCGLCHDGAPSRPEGVRFAAPGAPSCASCHQQGVLGCTTCHEVSQSGSHARHLAPAGQGAGLTCSGCHPLPGPGVIEPGGQHGDGHLDLAFDPALVAPGASYDAASRTCAVSCHDHGGARSRPAWGSEPLRCGDCHGAPPAAHYPGLCTTCHREANADGTALTPGPFHRNGKVDLGDGSGGCSACHGRSPDGWPATGAHEAHRQPALAAPVDCQSCHPTYDSVQSPGHLDGVVQVPFGPRARDRGAEPSWDGASCTSVACHGAGLALPPLVVPTWQDSSGAASQCGACHGVPPQQHTPSTDCGRSDCHGAEVQRSQGQLSITPAGRALHIDGMIQHNR